MIWYNHDCDINLIIILRTETPLCLDRDCSAPLRSAPQLGSVVELKARAPCSNTQSVCVSRQAPARLRSLNLIIILFSMTPNQTH
eukprot:9772615-Heterocapsa_arctica.AAC.1